MDRSTCGFQSNVIFHFRVVCCFLSLRFAFNKIYWTFKFFKHICIIMDEETTESVLGSSENTTVVTKPKKKVGSAKKADKAAASAKADKSAASAKKADKSETSTKKANNAVSAKKVDKAAVSTKKAGKEAEPPKEKKKTTLDLVYEAIEVVGSVEVICLFAFLSLLCLPLKFDTSVDHRSLNSSKSISSASVRRNIPHVFGYRPKLFRGENRKGASVQAIKKYVISKTEPTSRNLNSAVNKALTKGIETGTLVRPAAHKDVTGAVGFFRLAKVEVPKRTIKPVKRPEIDSEHASDSEATVKPVKPRKRNLSDTYIAEMKASLTSTPKPSVKTASAAKDKQTKQVPKKNANDKKDTSDSKIVLEKTKRKSVKSYSSDTEVDFKKSKTTKTAKEPLKKTASNKSKDGSPSKESKAKVKKLYNGGEGKGTKSGKTKAKK